MSMKQRKDEPVGAIPGVVSAPKDVSESAAIPGVVSSMKDTDTHMNIPNLISGGKGK